MLKILMLAGVIAVAGVAGILIYAAMLPDDFRVSITDPPNTNKAAYPISSFTWLLIPAQIQDAAKRDAIKGFLTWMLSEGQKYNEGLTYAQLPKEVIAKETKAISLIQ